MLDHLPEVFSRDTSHGRRSAEELTAPLFQEIRRLKVEFDWLKKCLSLSGEAKAMRIEARDLELSIALQC